MKYCQPTGSMCFGLFLFFYCHAIVAGSPGLEVNDEVRLMISAMILDDGVTTPLWVGDDDAEIKGAFEATVYLPSVEGHLALVVPFGRLSDPVHYRGSRNLKFFNTPAGGDDDRPPPVAAITLPEGIEEVLLVFVTDDFTAGTFRVLAFGLDEKNAAPESLRLINLSPLRLAWNLGGQQGVIEPLAVTQVSYIEEVGRVRLRFAAYNAAEESWNVQYNRLLRLRRDRRYECIILPRPSSAGEGFLVRIIADPGMSSKKVLLDDTASPQNR